MHTLTWPQVLAWRMRRQFLGAEAATDVVEIARRVAGVQAQVASAAKLAIAIRHTKPEPRMAERALLDERTLVKTWAMRGTLHLLPADEAGAYLSLCGAHRSWERASWQTTFGATPADLEAIADAAGQALAGGAELTREELTAQIVERTGSSHLAELLGSGWGTLLKPLAWWGVLCHGPARGNRVTFVSPSAWFPDWRGVPDLDAASGTVIRAYLRAHGPTTPDIFDKAWLSRGTTRKPLLRGWFAALEHELTTVEVEGRELLLLTEDVPELLVQRPDPTVRLLGAFDSYILGAGTNATPVVPADRRAEVSRTAGWISPVVLLSGRVVGVWRLDDGTVDVTLWEKVPRPALESEVERIAACVASTSVDE